MNEKKRIGFTSELIGMTVVVKLIGEEPHPYKIAEIRGDELILNTPPMDGEEGDGKLVFRSSIVYIELPTEKGESNDWSSFTDLTEETFET